MADQRILFFGDSFVGVGDPTAQGWVGRVAQASFGHGLPITTYNLGVRRQTSPEIAARWLNEANPRLVSGLDCRVVVSFGSNDTTEEAGELRASPAVSRQALVSVLSDAQGRGLRAFVVGPPPVGEVARIQRTLALADAFADVCDEWDVPFVDIMAPLAKSKVWRDEVQRGDGAHPAAGGYTELAAIVLANGWLDWLRRS